MGNYNKFVIEFASVFWDENVTMLGVTPDTENITGMMADWVNFYPVSGKYQNEQLTTYWQIKREAKRHYWIPIILSILGLPVLMTFMEGDEAFSSENLSDEQLLDIGTLPPIA